MAGLAADVVYFGGAEEEQDEEAASAEPGDEEDDEEPWRKKMQSNSPTKFLPKAWYQCTAPKESRITVKIYHTPIRIPVQRQLLAWEHFR